MTVVTSAPPVLSRAREVVQPAMMAAVDQLSPGLRQTAAYHLGWYDEAGTPTPDGGGKGVRPALAVLSAEAAGADASVGAPGAVAVELAHNFSLLHDDVIDGDRERRHRPTVWALHGVGRAIIVGDALFALAHQTLQAPHVGASPAARMAASAELTDAVAAMIAGQADDMAFEDRPTITVDECMGMVAGKTGALLSCAACIGAVLADALRSYGANLGVAFQAVDDLLGIWGDPGRTGKPRGADIAARKKSLPIVFALAAGRPAAEELRGILTAEVIDDAAVARGGELVEECGGRTATVHLARRHLDAALAALDVAEAEPRARAELIELAQFIIEREY
jgi:geranylgeranyl diphosphate synthase type I